MSVFGRGLHVIDVENLLGSGRFHLQDVSSLFHAYCRNMPLAECDQVVVAASSWEGAAAVGFGWPGARLLWQTGRDGADECLLSVLREENVASRFSRVIIASGDHSFASVADELRSSGCAVSVLSRPEALSPWLRHAASTVSEASWLLPEPPTPLAASVIAAAA
jgi:hypothetical protein